MADTQRKERHWLRLRTRREALPFLVIVVLTALVSFGAPRVLPFLTVFENWADDLRTGLLSDPLPQEDQIVVLAITEQTLALDALAVRSPIDRDWLAKQLQAVIDAGALAVGIDILFDQATEPARDDRLRTVLANSHIPIVTAWASGAHGLSPAQTEYLGAFTANNPPGSIVLRLDPHDGIARHVAGGNDQGVPAFSRRLAAAAGITAKQDDFRIAFRRKPGDGKPSIPVYPAEVAAMMPAQWFAGKIILIGADLPNSDRYPTPLAVLYGAEEGKLPGVLIHAHAVSQLLDGRQVLKAGKFLEAALVAAMALFGAITVLVNAPLAAQLGFNLLGLALLWGGGAWAFDSSGVLLPVAAPTLALMLSTGFCGGQASRANQRQKTFIQGAFSRYVDSDVVDHLIEHPELLEVGGRRRELTFLFTDIAGFTGLAEGMESGKQVKMLNAYLDGMSKIVGGHGGTLDKYVGDAVVAFFGAPQEQADHAMRAVACALDLDAFVEGFRAARQKEGIELGITRIGVHTGEATVGNIGGQARFDYTVIGDAVNTAARLESVNKHLGGRLCISQETASHCPDIRFRPVGTLVLKGKEEGLAVVEPVAEGHDEAALAAYCEAFDCLRDGDGSVQARFEDILRRSPDDALAAFHLARLRDGETGVRVRMTEK